ncbi:MAG: hypothetical protein JNJ96_11110 [Anaerolineales bacterium]|nr:hypothetical protein [Anaerolineales bacterium]
MNADNINFERKTIFPFYIFLTLLIGYMGIASVKSIWGQGESAALAA